MCDCTTLTVRDDDDLRTFSGEPLKVASDLADDGRRLDGPR